MIEHQPESNRSIRHGLVLAHKYWGVYLGLLRIVVPSGKHGNGKTSMFEAPFYMGYSHCYL